MNGVPEEKGLCLSCDLGQVALSFSKMSSTLVDFF